MKIIITFLPLFFVCCSKTPKILDEKPFFTTNKYGSFDSIQKLMDYQESTNFYSDSFFSVTRVDHGEWGGAVIFKDSTTKQKYAFYQSTIYAFGKTDSSYILFSHSAHGLFGSVTEILNPKKLFSLCDTCRLPNSNYWYKISDSISKQSNILKQITDLKDTLFDYVAIFSYQKQLYLIKSTKWFSNYSKYTILCTLNLNKNETKTVDTILNDQIYIDQPRPWPNNSPVYNPFSDNILIPVKSRTYRGFIQIHSDTITLIKDSRKASL